MNVVVLDRRPIGLDHTDPGATALIDGVVGNTQMMRFVGFVAAIRGDAVAVGGGCALANVRRMLILVLSGKVWFSSY
jgi:hypothetical protein